jgi:pantothenate kinase
MQPPREVPVVTESTAQLAERARRLVADGSRRILGITGAPGAGKSTLCAALLEALGEDAQLVGMDGFHLANQELARLGRSERKGAPDTFDVDGYVALLRRLRVQGDEPIYGPVFDRGLEESIGSAVPVDPRTRLVITEGNYLLLADDGWGQVRGCLDEAWYLDIDASLRGDRLVRRRQLFGHSLAESQSWVAAVDQRNAAVVESTRGTADLVVRLT